MPRKLRPRLCREGWYYLMAMAVVLLTWMIAGDNLLLLVAGMLFGPLWLSWRLVVATLRGLETQRKMPRGICAGDLLVVNVDVANTRKKVSSWAVVVEEEIRREENGRPGRPIRPAVYFPHVAAGQLKSRAYRGRLPQRGRYRFGPLRVSTRFPFGLFRHTIVIGRTDTLTVFPRLGSLAPGWLVRRQETFEGTARPQQHPSRVPDDLYGVREWRSGDVRRWVHWRSSARHDHLVVRQFERRRNRDVAVLVDLWQPRKPDTADLENVELAVSFAATVVAQVCRRGGAELLVGITDDEPGLITGAASQPLLQNAMERLAVAQATDQDRLPDLLDRTIGRIKPGTDVILVSPRAVELHDSQRFANIWNDPTRRQTVGWIRLVNTAENELSEFFQP